MDHTPGFEPIKSGTGTSRPFCSLSHGARYRSGSTCAFSYTLALLGVIMLLLGGACGGEDSTATPIAGPVPASTPSGSPCPAIAAPNGAMVTDFSPEAYACANSINCGTAAQTGINIFAGGEVRTGPSGGATLQSTTTKFELESSATLQLKSVGNLVELLFLKLGRLTVQHDPCGHDVVVIDTGNVQVEAVDTLFYVQSGDNDTSIAVKDGEVVITATLASGTDHIALQTMQKVDIHEAAGSIPTPSQLTDQDLKHFEDAQSHWATHPAGGTTVTPLPSRQTATELPTATMTLPPLPPTKTAELSASDTPVVTEIPTEIPTEVTPTPEQAPPTPTVEDTPTPVPTTIPSPTSTPALEAEPHGLIAFASNRGGGEQSQIYVMNADGSEQRALTKSPGYNLYPDWSPNGKWIAYVVSNPIDNPDSPGGTLHVIDAINGSELVNLKGIGQGHAKWPKWSPDSRYLVYADASVNTAKLYDIYLLEMSPDGSDLAPATTARIIARASGFDGYPAWGHVGDDDYIFFASERSNVGSSQIYALRPDTGKPIRLTSAPGDQSYPSISRDGKRLAFTSTRDGTTKIYILDLSTGVDGINGVVTDIDGAKPLTSGKGRDLYPTWSPGGGWLAFHSNRDDSKNYEIYLTRTSFDGTEQQVHRLTHDVASDDEPAWHP